MTATALRVLVVLALLALPTAAAAALKGEVEVAGPIGFVGDGPVTAPLLVAYGRIAGEEPVLGGTGTIRLEAYVARSMRAGATAMLPAARSREAFPDATFSVRGTGSGYLAVIPSDATLASIERGEATLEAQTSAAYGATTVGPSSRDETPVFSQTLDVPHFRLRADAPSFGPTFVMKIYGPTLTIADAEGTRTFETGYFPDPLDPSGLAGTERWIVVRVVGTARAEPAAPLSVAVGTASFSLDGSLLVRCIRGAITIEDGTFDSLSGRVALEGDFVGRAEPAPVPVLSFQGELRSVHVSDRPLDLAALRKAPLDVATTLIPVFLVAGLGAAIATWRFVTRVRRPQPTPETCLAEAALAIEAGEWTRALHWIGVGRDLAPMSARLAIERAFVLERRGDLDEAFAAYEEAAILGDDGLAEFHAARLAASAQRPGRAVAVWIDRALRRDPNLAAEILDDETLARYDRDPDVRAALRRLSGS